MASIQLPTHTSVPRRKQWLTGFDCPTASIICKVASLWSSRSMMTAARRIDICCSCICSVQLRLLCAMSACDIKYRFEMYARLLGRNQATRHSGRLGRDYPPGWAPEPCVSLLQCQPPIAALVTPCISQECRSLSGDGKKGDSRQVVPMASNARCLWTTQHHILCTDCSVPPAVLRHHLEKHNRRAQTPAGSSAWHFPNIASNHLR